MSARSLEKWFHLVHQTSKPPQFVHFGALYFFAAFGCLATASQCQWEFIVERMRREILEWDKTLDANTKRWIWRKMKPKIPKWMDIFIEFSRSVRRDPSVCVLLPWWMIVKAIEWRKHPEIDWLYRFYFQVAAMPLYQRQIYDQLLKVVFLI